MLRTYKRRAFFLIKQFTKLGLFYVNTKITMDTNRKFRIFLLFALAFCLCFTSNLSAEKKAGLKTVVIDAGHGGKDAGAVSRDKKTYEKTLTLDIAKRLGEKINEAYPEVKVVYTRTTDVYRTLNERADIANKNNADLFISIHINSNDKTSVYGPSVHILGQSTKRDVFAGNMDVCQKENSVMLLEDDYTTKYQGFDPTAPESFICFSLMQDAFFRQSILFASELEKQFHNCALRSSNYTGIHQDPFWLLWKTAMPAVLVELGFISNPTDLKTLRSEADRGKLAESLFKSFSSFKKKYDLSVAYTAENAKKAAEALAALVPAHVSDEGEQDNTVHPQAVVKYGVQIMCLGTELEADDSKLKDYKAKAYKIDGKQLYKYVVNISSSKEKVIERLPEVKKDFPDAFMVKIVDDIVIVYRN